jgi:hypothetical protein
MTVVSIIDEITKWADEQICQLVELKLPDDEEMDESHNLKHKLVNPAAWPLVVPSKDRVAPKVDAPTIPSLCIQLMPPASDNVMNHARIMTIRFSLATWNPGKYWLDTYFPNKDGPERRTYSHGADKEGEAGYRPTSNGWRDLYNFIDVTLRALEQSDNISADIRIMHEDGIDFGPFEESETKEILDYYPYWFAWVSFKVECGLTRNRKDIEAFI